MDSSLTSIFTLNPGGSGSDRSGCRNVGTVLRSRVEQQPKGPRKSKLADFAPGFGSGWIDLREQNSRPSRAYVESFATKERPEMARRWDTRTGGKVIFARALSR